MGRGFGFIDGDDGVRYFAHVSEVVNRSDLVPGQRVEFEPVPGRKGPRAVQVVPGAPAELLFLDPPEFIVARSSMVKGYEVVEDVGQAWGSAFGLDEARAALVAKARELGGNAVLDLTVERRSEWPSWLSALLSPNYRQTRHYLHGRVVTLKRRTWQ